MVCNKCGKKVTSGIKFCPECGSEIKEEKKDTKKTTKKEEKVETKVVDEENGYFAWGILGFFVPIAGLVLFLVWMNNKKKSAKAAGLGALIGFLVKLVLIIVSISGLFYTVFRSAPKYSIYDDDPYPSFWDDDYDYDDDDEEDDINNGDSKSIDISSIDTKKKLPSSEYSYMWMDNLKYGEEDYKDKGIIINYNYNQLVIKNDYTGEILFNYNNVKYVSYSSDDCAGLEFILVETTDKVYLINTRVHDLSNMKAVEIKGSYSYIYRVPNHSYTCGGSNIIIGIKDGWYDLNGEVKADFSNMYYYDSPNNYINTIRGYKLAGKTGSAKVIINSSVTDQLLGLVDVNNLAYTYGYDNGGSEETSKLELINTSPVQKVETSSDGIVILTFENGEQYSFEYAGIEY